MNPPPIRVVLVDDHTLFRKGLAELLEREGKIKVVGITGNPEEASLLVRGQQPDVVLMDLNMPPLGGLELLERLRAEGCRQPTLILTVSDDREDLANALRAGAQGYLLKDMEPDDVVDAVQRAQRGETVVAPAMTGKLVSLLQSGNQPTADEAMLNSLTQREREVLACLAQGMSNKAIARALKISAETVKLHVRHILLKLSLGSRVEAAVFAVERRLQPTQTSRKH